MVRLANDRRGLFYLGTHSYRVGLFFLKLLEYIFKKCEKYDDRRSSTQLSTTYVLIIIFLYCIATPLLFLSILYFIIVINT